VSEWIPYPFIGIGKLHTPSALLFILCSSFYYLVLFCSVLFRSRLNMMCVWVWRVGDGFGFVFVSVWVVCMYWERVG
jgi:hypothetical protein